MRWLKRLMEIKERQLILEERNSLNIRYILETLKGGVKDGRWK